MSGATFAFSQSLGREPVVSDLLKILVRTGAMLSAHSRKTLPGISSSPAALCGLMSLSNFSIPGTVTVISAMSGIC